MFSGAVEAAEPMAGSCSVAPAGTDQLDLEAAEQLIQLSGGDGADDDDAGSESRSADSVKCGGSRRKKEKEAAVESRSRSAGRIPATGKNDGNGNCGGGESDIKGVDSLTACSATAADLVVQDNKVVVVESCRRTAAEWVPAGKDRDGGILHGEARKRPRFLSLAAIYRNTEPTQLTAGGGGEGHTDRDPPEDERKKEKKRAVASKARR